jgi:hypothetical protein
MHAVMTGLGAVILLAICGLSGFFVIADRGPGDGAEASTTSGYARSIASRQVDARPLSVAEVFPRKAIRMTAGAEPYVVGATHIDGDCGIAATGAAAAVLDRHGCSQVVRAAVTAPYGGYRVTAGVFNLNDDVAAIRLAEQVRGLVEGGDGSFAAMSADSVPGSAPKAEPLSQVGWQERGHYLVYCVIAAPDGQLVRADDRYARRITTDLLESYLGGEILGARASGA